jgi:hypothetical protein
MKPNLVQFQNTLGELADDFTITFPEFAQLLLPWTTAHQHSLGADEVQALFDHCVNTFPEHFFDILYQNDKLFEPHQPLNLLPGVDFCKLFHCPDITDKTRSAMWKYLQVILFNIIGTVQDRSKFGPAAESAFAHINEEELLKKLTDAIQSMGNFFQEGVGDEKEGEGGGTQPNPGMPNPDELYGHLRGLFAGKIGTLAKEMAEEIAGDLSGLLGEDFQNMKSTKEVLEKLMKNPQKMAGLIQTVRDKLTAKLKSGEISQEEMLKEAQQIFGSMGMGDMGKDPNMKDMMKLFSKLTGKDFAQMMKSFGDLGKSGDDQEQMFPPRPQTVYQGQGVRTGGGGGISSTTKEKMKNRMMKTKMQLAETQLNEQKRREEAESSYVPYHFDDDECPVTTERGKKVNKVFTIPGEEQQQTTSAPRETPKQKKKR